MRSAGRRTRTGIVRPGRLATAIAIAVGAVAGLPGSAGAAQITTQPTIHGDPEVGSWVSFRPGNVSFENRPGTRNRFKGWSWLLCSDAAANGCTEVDFGTTQYFPAADQVGKYLVVDQYAEEEGEARYCERDDFFGEYCYDEPFGSYDRRRSNVVGPIKAAPVVVAPEADGVPTVSSSDGSAIRVGTQLTSTQGAWKNDPTEYAYEWRRCPGKTSSASCTVIKDATHESYRPTLDDDQQYLRVKVTASNTAGSASQTSVGVLIRANAPTAQGAPVVTPSDLNAGFRVGNELMSGTGDWGGDPAQYTYQWRRCPTKSANGSCTAIAGATGARYTPRTEDDGSYVRVNVTAKNSGGSATQTSASSLVRAYAPVPAGPPVLSVDSGDGYRVGSVLRTTSGVWQHDPGTYTYQWRSCPSKSANGSCTSIAGATGSTYTATPSDAGKYVRVNVTAKSSGGSAVQYSPNVRIAP